MDSLNKEWHNKIEEAKNNLKKWEESVQSYLYFKYRPQLFDRQDPNHAAAAKNFEMFWSTKEFLNPKPNIDQIQQLIEAGKNIKLDSFLNPKPNIDQVQQLIQPGKDWRPNRRYIYI